MLSRRSRVFAPFLLSCFLSIFPVLSQDNSAAGQSQTQTQPPAPPRLDIYGFIMTDFGYDLRSNDPDWFDVVRPTKLPSSHYSPVEHIVYGGELQWARRTNFADGFHSNDYRVQFSFKYNFSAQIGGVK